MKISSRTMLVAAFLGASACAPATPPVTIDAAPSTSVAAVPPPCESAATSAAIALPSPATSASAEPLLPAPDTGAGGGFHCFSWAHQRDFSTDCFRTQATCLSEAKRMEEGARPSSGCEARPHASCTTLRGKDERCFGDAANCGRYRAFVARNQIETSACVPR